MKWIRNPLWDLCWIWSGLPIGLAAIIMIPGEQIGSMVSILGERSVPALVPDTAGSLVWAILITVMILETGHFVSPMIMAWSKLEFREIVRREWGKYIIAPIGLVVGCLLLPWTVVLGLYFAWNGWHFGMQLFGISCLYARPRDVDARVRRALLIVGLFVLQYVGIAFIPSPSLQLLAAAVVSFNHWLTDIGLSGQISGRRWIFIPLVLTIGVVWLLLRNGPLSAQVVPQILAIRAGLGMIHFVYSARVWKLSDPQIRTAIGKELFA